jgi:putative tricarboxylic transport membrane protein
MATAALGHAQPPIDSIHFLIPGSAGGGWDRTARGAGQALTQSGLVGVARFENMSGGGGGKAIAHLIEVSDPRMLMVNSTPIVIRSLKNVFPQSFRDLTPIASIIGDYSVIAVRRESEFANLQALLDRQRDQPRKVAIAGGSVGNGMDHLVAAMIVQGAGGDPISVKYIPYDTGGKAMAGLLSGETQALASSYSEVIDLANQNWVRILCIASEARLAMAPDTPTCHEAGSSQAVFVNWRGFFAAPGISTDQAMVYQQTLAAMYHTPAWVELRDRNGWVDIYKPGAAFTRMLEDQEQRLAALMTQLGLD